MLPYHPYPIDRPARRAVGDGFLQSGRSNAAADLLFSAARMARGIMFCSVGPRLDLLPDVLWTLPGSAATAIGVSRLAQSP